MIAQLMAQRLLTTNHDLHHVTTYKTALRLCASNTATVASLAHMQAEITRLPKADGHAEIRDLLQRALTVRRQTLASQEKKKLGSFFKLENVARLVA